LCPIFECDDVEFVLVMKFDHCPTALYDHLIEEIQSMASLVLFYC